MEISPAELLAEARAMALHTRFLERRNRELVTRVSELEAAAAQRTAAGPPPPEPFPVPLPGGASLTEGATMTYLHVDTDASFTPVPVPISDRKTGSPGTPIPFNRRVSDSGGHWGGSADPHIVCQGGATGFLAKGVISVRLEDFTSGTELQFQPVEYDAAGVQVEGDYEEEFYAPKEHDLLPRDDPEHDRSVIHKRFPVMSFVNAGHRLAFLLRQYHDSDSYTGDDGTEIPFRLGVIVKARCMLEIGPR